MYVVSILVKTFKGGMSISFLLHDLLKISQLKLSDEIGSFYFRCQWNLAGLAEIIAW